MPKALADRMLFVCFRPRGQNQTNTVPFGHCMSTECTTTNMQNQLQLPAKKKKITLYTSRYNYNFIYFNLGPNQCPNLNVHLVFTV